MKKPYLLLADDDEDDRFLFSRAIASLDQEFMYVMVNNGKEVMAMLDNDFISQPDYILLDLNMPVMNGLECLCAIKKNPVFKDCNVVVYSTTMDEAVEEALIQAGAAACFVKPPGLGALGAVLRDIFKP